MFGFGKRGDVTGGLPGFAEDFLFLAFLFWAFWGLLFIFARVFKEIQVQ